MTADERALIVAAIEAQLDAALAERHRAHASALFLAGREAEIAASLQRLQAHDALLRPGLVAHVAREVIARFGGTLDGDA